MIKNKLWIAIGLLVLTACSDWPPAVGNVGEINALPANEKAIRAFGITDHEVSLITQRLADLDYIFFNSQSKITDKSIADMARLKCMRQIVIEDCSLVTDDGLKSFQIYPSLRELILKNGIQISNRGLENLVELKKLQLLHISNWPKVEHDDLDRLRKSLPHCNIKDITGK